MSSQLDHDMAAAAYRKVMQGQTPTAQERSALKRYEKEQEEKRRWEYYGTIPKKHWCEMSGRAVQVINRQGATYGLPLEGRAVDLPKFVRAFHDFLAVNSRRLAGDEETGAEMDASTTALGEYRRERTKLARLDRRAREGELIPRDQVREGLGRIAAILRVAGDSLQRQYGTGAGDILYEALDDAEQDIDRIFGSESDGEPEDEPGD